MYVLRVKDCKLEVDKDEEESGDGCMDDSEDEAGEDATGDVNDAGGEDEDDMTLGRPGASERSVTSVVIRSTWPR
jgi:hypothetical protein